MVLWPHSQKGGFGESREKPSRMFVLRSSLRGAWLPAESLQPLPCSSFCTSRASPLHLQLDGSRGLCSWVRVRAHSLGLSRRDRTPGETGVRECFCWKMVGLFLSIFPAGKKRRRADRREGEKGRGGKDRREERKKEGR